MDRDPDFYVMDLVQDNLGRTRMDPTFRENYKNDQDSQLGDKAPPDMYVAKIIGQQTLVVG